MNSYVTNGVNFGFSSSSATPQNCQVEQLTAVMMMARRSSRESFSTLPCQQSKQQQ